MLDLGSFFTTGTDEVRQWTIRKGTKAPQAAGVIHGGMSFLFAFPYAWSILIGCLADFEKTFIQCIVYNFEVLKEYGDEAEVKAKGKVLTKGKDYVVEVRYRMLPDPWTILNYSQDGDIILIKAGAAKS